ncbi:MAG: DEAD/DEAH box helicase, partial [Clostridia bacterium]|nr:DEAD/DEAH box helicase [Clostridia bacterium]
MTNADRIFERFPEFIREYIYSHNWQHLRDVQLVAADVLFNSEDNLLLSSATASGKTEAVFFPILADLCENKPQKSGISVLYIAPLKSLINDQFYRLDELLDMSGIPVCHWHGDVGASQKAKLLKDPSGILQITPESLESMLINRASDIPRLFGALRYVVIDEIHTMIGSDRGCQVICQLCRIAKLIGHTPRRIGLSATIGDLALAGDWLGAGSGRATRTPATPKKPLHWRLAMEHFFILEEEREDRSKAPSPFDPGFAFLYEAGKNKKTLVFSNSREETEYVTATLRNIARAKSEDDIFLIHHGNLSASLREDAELKMKDEAVLKAVTCATVTMELGIDIGRLERVAQIGAPTSVSSFLQRLGRSGRREAPPEMVELFREEAHLPNTPLPQLIPWELLRAIALVELYTAERFIEPPRIRKMPLSLAFHQTLSILAASGELTPAALAQKVLSLPPLSSVPKETYREMLLDMIGNDFLEMTEEKGLIIGLKGEKLISSFKFYAVFKDSEDYTVRCESDEIGTITNPPPIGDRFALAGRVWEVEELDIPRKLVYVHPVNGKMQVSWPGDYGEIHTRILHHMRRVLAEDTVYPYLKPNAAHRLEVARHLARNTGLCEHSLLHLGGSTWCLFPFLGTRSFRTLRRFLAHNAQALGISGIQFEGCRYITFHSERSREDLLMCLADVSAAGVDRFALVSPSEQPLFDKYDAFIPAELLRRA